MRTDFEREDFVVLLARLKSEEEAEILAAVRDINAKMTVAGVTWDDLLISQGDTAPDNYDNDDYDDDDDDDENDEKSAPLSDEEKQEATSLIEAIGGMEISDQTKQDLEEYADDLKEGDFEQMDLRYLRALKTRLSA